MGIVRDRVGPEHYPVGGSDYKYDAESDRKRVYKLGYTVVNANGGFYTQGSACRLSKSKNTTKTCRGNLLVTFESMEVQVHQPRVVMCI